MEKTEVQKEISSSIAFVVVILFCLLLTVIVYQVKIKTDTQQLLLHMGEFSEDDICNAYANQNHTTIKYPNQTVYLNSINLTLPYSDIKSLCLKGVHFLY